MKIELEGVHETLLIPLWLRAQETRREDSIIVDEGAVSLVKNIAYDFSKFSSGWMSQVGVAIRTMLLDRATMRFLGDHPDTVIINIGAGLDTRCDRLDRPGSHWYDLDVPEVIALRKRFYENAPDYTMIAQSVFDYSWIEAVQSDNRPVLILAEGVLMYFEEREVRELMNILAENFPGAEMLFEIISPLLVKQSKRHDTVKHTDARFKWGVYGGRHVESFSRAITFIEEWNYLDYYPKRWKWFRWPAKIPAFKRRFNSCIVHVAFTSG